MSTDHLLAALSLLGLIAFLSALAAFVPDADLLAVLLIAVALAAFDFWRYARKRNGGR